MWVFLLFPVSVLGAVLGTLLAAVRSGRASLAFRQGLLVLIYLAGVYLVGLALVWMDPTWEDNGVIEFIPVEQRWRWAFLEAGVVELMSLPVLVVSLLRWSRRG